MNLKSIFIQKKIVHKKILLLIIFFLKDVLIVMKNVE